MTNGRLQIEFVYSDGKSQPILDELRELLDYYDGVEVEQLVIKPQTFGNIQMEKYEEVLEH